MFVTRMVTGILGKKIDQSQRFLEDGMRVPITVIGTAGNIITQIKTQEKDGYRAIQLGFRNKKRAKKPLLGQIKKAGIQKIPRFFREIAIAETQNDQEAPKVGMEVHAHQIFKPGDIVQVTGVSKGKGFAGVVKRHHFKGGPRTHGQSDRERAPGSIGQTTTPGRVYKGKRMAGRMGHERVTIKNLQVVDVLDDQLVIKGLVPGERNNLLMIQKLGESKKFLPLYKEEGGKDGTEDKKE